MPRRRTAWSAWNYLTTSSPLPSSTNPSGGLQTVSLTYNMNILQHISSTKYSDVLVTLNPETPPASSLTQAKHEYRHPLFNARMIAAQEQLDKIQGKKNIWYAGAWTGYGFHEDGCRSGITVGQKLGGDVPWEVIDAKFMRGLKPTLAWRDHAVRLAIRALQAFINIIELVMGVQRHCARSKANHAANGVMTSKKKSKST